jgi:hypothetical protein
VSPRAELDRNTIRLEAFSPVAMVPTLLLAYHPPLSSPDALILFDISFGLSHPRIGGRQCVDLRLATEFRCNQWKFDKCLPPHLKQRSRIFFGF